MNRLRTSLLLCFLFALSFMQTAQAQGIPSEGKDFYLGYIHPTFNDVVPAWTAGYFRVYAYVSSFQDNTVSVSYFDPLTKREGYPNNYPVKARQTTQIALDRTQMQMKSPGDIAGEFKSCHITSKKPINVQFFSSGANSGGSYLALPVNAWGKEYVAASYNDNGPGDGAMTGGRGPASIDPAGGVFMVIAAYDGTEVTIIPTARTGGDHYGVNQGIGNTGKPQPYNVGLNRGQCWMVKSKSAFRDDGTDDISASIIKSNKPVAVISGHEDAYIYGSDVAGFNLEARDYMVEQMIPVEYWDNTGHITVPFIDSPNNNGEGVGEHARIYVYDKYVPSTVTADRAGLPFTKYPGTYQTPEEMTFSTDPVHFHADSGKRFMVVQYDIRNHSTQRTTPPFPSPSMMSIVPRAMWRNAYMWYVPSNINEKLQAYYVTVIAPKDGSTVYYEPRDEYIANKRWFSDSIRVSINGSNSFTGISGLGSSRRTFNSIPGHPDLKAVTFQVSPGVSYYAKAPFPFVIYHFGCRAVDSDGDLGDFDNDDNFFSYALPLGMALHKPVPKRMRITVDTLCTGWKVTVHDSNDPGGVKTVTLLDDPNGEIIVGGHYQYKNTSFEPKDDPLNLKEITVEPPKRDFSFNVRVDNPGVDAYAPLYIVDVNGNGKILELRYKQQAVSFTPPDSVGLVFRVNDAPRDLVEKYRPYVDEEVCREYLFTNLPQSPRAYKITKVDIPQPSNFRIASTNPQVPCELKPGETLQIMACFKGPDTMLYLDSIEFETDCFPARLPLQGQAGTPLIVAQDYDFGTILIGSKKCHDVEVKNVGNKPFTLDDKYILNNFKEFSFDPGHNKNGLPITLLPGQSHKFYFCYSPVDEGLDSATMDWSTDIKEPYKGDIKSYSDFWGAGIMPGVNWDRPTEQMTVICEDDTVHRVYLLNTGTASAQLTGIWFDGPDKDEFSIVATEYQTNPPTYAGTVIDTAQKMWVDVRFTPNLSKTPKYGLRTAFLKTSATLTDTIIPTIAFSGVIKHGEPVLTTNTATDIVDYGYVEVGVETKRTIKIENKGDAPLIITSFIAPGTPYTRMQPDLNTMLPFSIDPGVTVSFDLFGAMNTYGDTTVPFVFNYKTSCAPPSTPLLQFKSRKNDVKLGIPEHPPTYITCRTSEVDGFVRNQGNLVDINLRTAWIVDGAAPNNQSSQFTFVENGGRTLDLKGKVLPSGQTELIPVRYTPTAVGNPGAYLKVEWDSAGKVFMDSTPILATGVALANTFSVENTAGQPYTARTNEFFTIPARITDNITGPPNAAPPGARGATFTVTWKGDLFRFPDAGNQFEQIGNLEASVVSGPSRDLTTGNESVTIHVQTSDNTDIVNAGELVGLKFQLMVAPDVQSDIVISDGFFTDASGAPICYIFNQHIPATFEPIDNCGDPTLRGFLRGTKPTTITYLNPNPAVPGSDLKLGYRVNVALAPVTIELYNVLGDKVRTLQADKASAKGDHIATIVTEGLAAGAYTIRLSGTDWSETKSFVIEK
jgi:hypothetical protein